MMEELEVNDEESCSGCSGRTTARVASEYRNLVNRLNRIEGQLRGVKKMVDNDAYCVDILIQVAAINGALNGFNRALIASHMKNCVAHDLKEGKEESIDELLTVLQKLMK